MRESNGKVWPVQMADGMRVVMRPSGQGGFQVQKVAPWMCRGPAAHSCACANLHSGSLKGNDEPFGTIRVEAAYQKIIAKVRKAS